MIHRIVRSNYFVKIKAYFLDNDFISVQFLETSNWRLASGAHSSVNQRRILIDLPRGRYLLMSCLLKIFYWRDTITKHSNRTPSFVFDTNKLLNWTVWNRKNIFSTISVSFNWEHLNKTVFTLRCLISKRPFPNILLSLLCSLY